MPGFDNSGPMGNGPMTGRAQGLCNPAGTGAMGNQYGYGRGMRCGRGFGGGGRGMRRGFGFSQPYDYAQPPVRQVDEKQALKNQADQLQSSLERIQQRLDELEDGE